MSSCVSCGMVKSKYIDANGLKICKMCKEDTQSTFEIKNKRLASKTLLETCCRVIIENSVDAKARVPEGAINIWKCLAKVQRR